MLTKKHFTRAAEFVHAILDGDWRDEPPGWADASKGDWQSSFDETQEHYTRAVQLAEVFVQWFSEANPRFDQVRFLAACGLSESPAVRGPRKSKRLAACCAFCRVPGSAPIVLPGSCDATCNSCGRDWQ